MRKQTSGLVMALIIVLGVAGWGISQKTSRVRVVPAQVENDIHDHLPIGSSRIEVAAFLDDRKIEHSYIGESTNSDHCNCEIALVRNTAFRWPIRSDIQIYFMFDTKLKLVSYSVKEIYTGP